MELGVIVCIMLAIGVKMKERWLAGQQASPLMGSDISWAEVVIPGWSPNSDYMYLMNGH